ncbi:MAG: hypothetical protein IRZ00_18045 [Gemmatimonadetes bacterium]|nr:hypothetical protein [Gemmatimonadota bacterium]
MATVPGPKPDQPLPTPGAPAEEPVHEPYEEPGVAAPERGAEPDWLPAPYEPDREATEEEVALPLGA